jgi:hypothetical protein
VFVGDVAGQNRAGKTGFFFLKSYVGFAEFAGAKILHPCSLLDALKLSPILGPFLGLQELAYAREVLSVFS